MIPNTPGNPAGGRGRGEVPPAAPGTAPGGAAPPSNT